jgi:hypothetical protein
MFALRNMQVGESILITCKRKCVYNYVTLLKKENPHLKFKYTVKSIIRIS